MVPDGDLGPLAAKAQVAPPVEPGNPGQGLSTVPRPQWAPADALNSLRLTSVGDTHLTSLST